MAKYERTIKLIFKILFSILVFLGLYFLIFNLNIQQFNFSDYRLLLSCVIRFFECKMMKT